MILNFFLLIAGHILGDFYLQLNKFAKYKRKSILALLCHAIIWSLLISMGLLIAHLFLWWKFILLCSSHFLIDWLKIKLFRPGLGYLHPVNIVDQLLHVLTIIITLAY